MWITQFIQIRFKSNSNTAKRILSFRCISNIYRLCQCSVKSTNRTASATSNFDCYSGFESTTNPSSQSAVDWMPQGDHDVTRYYVYMSNCGLYIQQEEAQFYIYIYIISNVFVCPIHMALRYRLAFIAVISQSMQHIALRNCLHLL